MDKKAVLASLDLEQFYRVHVKQLKLVGQRQEALGMCPFHDDHNPSFSVNLGSGLWKCFSCGASGDVFDFYQRINGVSFAVAIRDLGHVPRVGEGVPVKQKLAGTFKYENIERQLLYWKERV